MAYIHASLQKATSIRLLHLHPGSDSDSLKADLNIHQLEYHSPYDALSYVWGEPDQTASISIHTQRFLISKNLYSVLIHLRRPDTLRILWVDAICINQDDVLEKGHQVALMGRIYRQASDVICWLGPLSTHRLWALKYLQSLAEDASNYLELDQVEYVWIIDGLDDLLPTVDTGAVISAALSAHVEAVYESDWFTRLWIAQELALAQTPKLICGTYELSYQDFELATRVIAGCLHRIRPSPDALRCFMSAWNLIITRGRYALNTRPVSEKPLILRIDMPWTIGRFVWDMRDKDCKDDRDRVYALLSLTDNVNRDMVEEKELFIPDYTRSVEWAYYQFWRRFGGYSSFFYAGLSRRRDQSKKDEIEATRKGEDVMQYFKDDYLPSWAPDLRPYRGSGKEWKPIFSFDYATSTPFHHKDAHFTNGPVTLMIRGHRFDTVVCSLHIKEPIEPCQKLVDFVKLRNTIKFLLLLKVVYKTYPSGQSWTHALRSTLITDMPYEQSHPFQEYLDAFKLKTRLSDTELDRIWTLYQIHLLSDSGEVWQKFCSTVVSRAKMLFDPFAELSYDGQLAWILHKYLGAVLTTHRFVITSRGYMGLGPPDTAVGDVVVALGGPSVPFVVQDTSAVINAGLTADTMNGKLVPDAVGNVLSRLLGPCYVQGIMRAEMWKEERYKAEFEWETDKFGTIPRPTLWLI